LIVFGYKKRLELLDIGQIFFKWLQYSDFCHPATLPLWNG
jgi:hypothetical protein